MYQHHPYVSVNGQIEAASDIQFPFDNIGFLYGYGLFETILVHNGKGVFLEAHFNRMVHSAQGLKLPFLVSHDQFLQWITALIKKNEVKDARLNLYLTADNFTTAHGFFEVPSTSLWMLLRPLAPTATRPPVKLFVKQETELRSPLHQHKTMSYLRNFYELIGKGQSEDILWTDPQGNLLETSFSTVCLVQGKRVATPMRPDIIPGITRTIIQKSIEKLGLKWEERKVHRSELTVANEIFLCSGIQGVIGVGEVSGYTGLASQAVTTQICEVYRGFVEADTATS